MHNEPNDVEFGDPELTKPDTNEDDESAYLVEQIAVEVDAEDARFGDPELCGPRSGTMTEEQMAAAETLNLFCPICYTPLIVSAKAFKDGKVDRCARCQKFSDAGDDIIAKQDAEDLQFGAPS